MSRTKIAKDNIPGMVLHAEVDEHGSLITWVEWDDPTDWPSSLMDVVTEWWNEHGEDWFEREIESRQATDDDWETHKIMDGER